MNPHQIIKRPLITEKNTNLMRFNKYSFEVDRNATKPQIKRAIEEIFNVRVTAVHTMNVRGKLRRRGRQYGYTADWKKAIVTLAEGDRIDLFEGA
ncbi:MULTISPECIES: 50S ribosomal protein L23 [unclassified Roseiflexus]|jgi:large subunit ribosomal protein L23|uniref:Large ribosomal subunit protein uL23 n=1 Tax=Roseiflexus sp. (strain RS-1) TaxID=357808 RepID=RL23_ROSS1|nr:MULTISPECIES: 50S ribosomal protein L23 [unclassified Roseiflexus]A5USI7.1 RecName: Full=Large ribosomal subunit protein uL23; AltName: Full=50S ribosomal protein L23 [Roseiflexus sp. RS-1]ABQ89590.1 LSU ribosomal protein L23P [Roseiflexus sp. RS-1]MBO9320556.1 50S ribosomal protein L23 [Roseiflexus sp.]MBO9340933.1 50S ribosomal protein L23 [Roseiflexus sp.]MCL6541885.1 50S ribosomal protein L23 [Roseiflexus sp.]